jgi:hypothetical protein
MASTTADNLFGGAAADICPLELFQLFGCSACCRSSVVARVVIKRIHLPWPQLSVGAVIDAAADSANKRHAATA